MDTFIESEPIWQTNDMCLLWLKIGHRWLWIIHIYLLCISMGSIISYVIALLCALYKHTYNRHISIHQLDVFFHVILLKYFIFNYFASSPKWPKMILAAMQSVQYVMHDQTVSNKYFLSFFLFILFDAKIKKKCEEELSFIADVSIQWHVNCKLKPNAKSATPFIQSRKGERAKYTKLKI